MIIYFVGFVFLLGFIGCSTEKDKAPVKIAISKGSPKSSYANYYNWIEVLDSTVVSLDMYDMPIDSAIEIFRGCSGLLLTGGTDINPDHYDKAYDTVRCWPIDGHRDLLEKTLIDSALAWGMPVLGICRGHQMLNVALGGSLIVDIPTDFDTLVRHQCEDYLSCFHAVHVDTTSLLYEISGVTTGEVNTNHHQAADDMPSQLKAVAFSADGLVESLAWAEPEGNSFLLGVQWHPERMNLENPMSGKIGKRFLKECNIFSSQFAVKDLRTKN